MPLVPCETLRMVYFALFASHMNYCCQLWGQPTNQQVRRINVLQNHALRLMTFSHYRQHSSPLFKFLNILKFKDYVTLLNVVFIHDIFSVNLPSALIDTFAVDFSHKHATHAARNGLINQTLTETTSFRLNKTQ